MAMRSTKRARIERASLALAVALGGVVTYQGVPAQPADSVTVDVGECVNLKTPEERFACYERQVEAQRQRSAAPAAAPEARSAGSPTPPPAVSPAAPAPAAPAPPATVGAQPQAAGAPAAAPSNPRSAAAGGGDHDAAPDRRSSDDPESADLREIVATVTALKQTVPNAYVITLDNGQVWRQNRPQWYPLKTGQRVRLWPTQWGGSYRLAVDELNGFIQVERVR
jgi:hypothetical protein